MRAEKHNRKLLVEGNDDKHVIWALCEKFNIIQNFDVVDCNGIENILVQIPIRFKQSEISTIGIMVDADNDMKSRWASLKNILAAQGFTIPNELPKQGLVLNNADGKRIGVWIMPNNNLNGMLEDFISFLVPKDDKLLPIVNSTLQNIEDQNLNMYSLTHQSKVIIHTWLAWQENPGTPMGLGITKRYLTTNEATCIQLTNWLTSLFNK